MTDNTDSSPLASEILDLSRRRAALDASVAPLPPDTRIVAVSNQKGGVGKTTTTVNLAAALAAAGARVLVIDLDPQGNASTALGIDHHAKVHGTYEVLLGAEPLASIVQVSPENPNLWCAPATINLAGAEIELVAVSAREGRLKRAIEGYLGSIDEKPHYIFIDCPPSLGLLTINALTAANEVFVPIQAEYYALEGVTMLWDNIAMVRQYLNPRVSIMGILLTMYDPRTNLSKDVADEVRRHFPDLVFSSVIPRSVRVSEAPSFRRTVIDYDRNSAGAVAYREAALEFAERGVY
ncbi:MAG: ParA family protein [Microbacteriaceae bacterium]